VSYAKTEDEKMSSHIQKRGNAWRCFYDVPSPDGKRRRKSFTHRGTKREAREKLTEITVNVGKGIIVADHNTTLGQYIGQWIDNNEHKLSPTTIDGYRGILRAHINKTEVGRAGFVLGAIKMQLLESAQVEAYYNGYRWPIRRLSERSLHHHHALLRRVLNYAVNQNHRGKNPVHTDIVPKPEHTDITVVPGEDNIEIINLFEGQYRTLISLLLSTGMSRSEVLALKWGAVDLHALEIRIRGALVKSETRGELVLRNETKTKTRRRTIKIGDNVANLLRQHKATQAEARLAAGDIYQDQDLVFATPIGGLLFPDSLSREFKNKVRPTRFNGLTLHGLRHSHASQLIKDDVNIKTLSARLGHSTISITLDIYGHLLPGMDERAAAVADRFLA
jgi:integrase|tara:strand:- start:144 stop:1316 length:1173 start_codon:yes stop_codon:yes gene_type:complete